MSTPASHGDAGRAPVLVGLGELVRRPGEHDAPAPDPGAFMAAAVERALEDTGAAEGLRARIGAVGAVPSAAWLDGDPGRRVADLARLDARTLRTSLQGGNAPQLLVGALAARIAAGELDAAVVCGAEALHTVASAARAGAAPDWPAPDTDRAPDEVLEEDRAPGTQAETEVGLIAPIMAYPLIENAIRAAAGRSVAAHQQRIAGLWAGFSAVAAEQEAAWTPRARSAEEIGAPSATNRLVTFPYTKLMNANIQVDQAAALVLCSSALADELGIPAERRVHPVASAHAVDEWCLSERAELHRSPAIAACGAALFAHAGIAAADLGPVDLYSCFPAAVELAAGELGLPLDDHERPLTCTGGLTFFGGPGNAYALHGIAAVARALRGAPDGTVGLATALGWYATKHALGLYASSPPARPFAALHPTPEPAHRDVAEPGEHEGVAETCTVIYDRDGRPTYGIVFVRLDDGRRALAKTDDQDVLARLPADDFLGSRLWVAPDRTLTPLPRAAGAHAGPVAR